MSLLGIKIFKVEKDKYEGPLNIVNLIFCILCTILVGSYVFELLFAMYAGYIYEQFAFTSRALGSYWMLYVVLMLFPLLLTQLFWRKKNRVNLNLALFILIMFNIQLWLERIYIVVRSF